ncbi:NmrA/HSCARG family protein [Aspergillus novofumigatus IBT 16806]|uniref:NAD(P)-binding protein n=1 Tax=Aspergillus novofumigatus (strain IBT 16806) TaxID=1392255 RepID=A0A2I1CJZ7_ASPN1|nr:NAD(P)-binding protein [Aspergillus novofumigatus IBT 16806]PKX97950.1 NAD(P)-binding protein [Aspergillus novofumigatus IBT 16806]
MSSKKLIVILGATGNQGGSVAETFLQEPEWRVRAITRNPLGPKAQALAARGADIIKADLDDPSSFGSAFEDAQVIFAVSDFWGLYGDPANQAKAAAAAQPLNVWAANHETQQLKDIIDAAAKVPSLERFVLSSLSDATKWSGGKYSHVYHFDSKATAETYGRENHPELWAKTSIFQAGYFLSNFVSNPITHPRKNASGVAQFIGGLDPDVDLPFIAAEEDTGPIVRALVLDSAAKKVIGYRARITLRRLIETFSQVTGMKAEAVVLPKGESVVPFPSELQQELDDNWAYWKEFGYYGGDPTVVHPQDLEHAPKLNSVADYFKKQDWSKVFGP